MSHSVANKKPLLLTILLSVAVLGVVLTVLFSQYQGDSGDRAGPATPVKAKPIAKIPDRGSLVAENQWRSSAEAAKHVVTPVSAFPPRPADSLIDDTDPDDAMGEEDMADSTDESTDSNDNVAHNVPPLYQTHIVPINRSAQEMRKQIGQWSAINQTSQAENIEMRKRLAQGERLYERVLIRRDAPFEDVRLSAQEETNQQPTSE